jgi:hypothetical protein
MPLITECFQIIYCLDNYGVVLLLVIVVSTSDVPMSPRYGGYRITTPPSYYKTTSNATTSYYTKPPNYYTEEAECCTATYAAPVYYTEAHKYYSAPSYYQRLLTTLRPPSIKLQLTLPPDTTLKLRSYPPPRKWNNPIYASPSYYTQQQL